MVGLKVWCPVSDLAAEKRSTILGSLKSQLWGAQAKYAVASVTLSSSVSSAISGALKADSTRVDRLGEGGDLGRAVTSGTLTHAKWIEIAKLTWEDVAAQMRYMGESVPSWNRIWGEVIAPTAATIADGAKQAADIAGSYAPWLLALAGLVVLLMLTNNARALAGR